MCMYVWCTICSFNGEMAYYFILNMNVYNTLTPLREISQYQQLTGVHNVTGVKLSDGLLYPGMTRGHHALQLVPSIMIAPC